MQSTWPGTRVSLLATNGNSAQWLGSAHASDQPSGKNVIAILWAQVCLCKPFFRPQAIPGKFRHQMFAKCVHGLVRSQVEARALLGLEDRDNARGSQGETRGDDEDAAAAPRMEPPAMADMVWWSARDIAFLSINLGCGCHTDREHRLRRRALHRLPSCISAIANGVCQVRHALLRRRPGPARRRAQDNDDGEWGVRASTFGGCRVHGPHVRVRPPGRES